MAPPCSALALRAVSLALLLLCTSAAFEPSDLRGMYIFRFGAGSCPARLTFTSTSLTVAATDISINDSSCSTGTLSAAANPSSESFGLLARYLRGTREASDFVAISVDEDLVCPARSFKRDTVFIFTAADANFTVSWTTVFENSSTYLTENSPTNDLFLFARGKQHLIINNLCMYDRIDIPNPPGRKCFPAAATVATPANPALPLPSLRIGDLVSDGPTTFSRVLAFTHAHPADRLPVVRLHTPNGTLTASHGHFIHAADARLVRAGDVRVGARLRLGSGALVPVERVAEDVDIGVYNPQTESGNVVIDGFLCSCYTDAVQPPAAAHALLAPVRALAALLSRADPRSTRSPACAALS